MDIQIRKIKEIKKDEIIHLYKANIWSSADKPDELYNALLHSHTLLSAWDAIAGMVANLLELPMQYPMDT